MEKFWPKKAKSRILTILPSMYWDTCANCIFVPIATPYQESSSWDNSYKVDRLKVFQYLLTPEVALALHSSQSLLSVMVLEEFAIAEIHWYYLCAPMGFHQQVQTEQHFWGRPAICNKKDPWNRLPQSFFSCSMRPACSLHKIKWFLPWNFPL